MSPEKTGIDKARNDIRPFCPVHHWRMAHDAGSTKIGPSYRCSYGGCGVRYTAAQGYWEQHNPGSAQNFVVNAEILCCTYNPEHFPAIVGYAKQSVANQTLESRLWQCLDAGCSFSLRQKLSPALSETSTFVSNHAHLVEHDHALWPR